MLPFKGLYWYGSWEPGRLQRHVYPVPDPRNPFLGVHLTVTVDGRAKIGPTAIPSLWRKHLVNQGRELVPSVRPADFTEKGRPGVRAQLLNVREGKLEMDFVVRPGERSTHVLNAVSPAWTSSLAVADYVVERIEA